MQLLSAPRRVTDALQILEEPSLEFRYEQRLSDPRDGLGLFGPWDADLPSHLASLTYGVIGHSEGVEAFEKWSTLMNGPLLTSDQYSDHLWPHYPGFEAAFCAKWPRSATWTQAIDRNRIVEASKQRDPHKRTYDVVATYLEGLRTATKIDESIGVIFCVIPDEVYDNCRMESHLKDGIGLAYSREYVDAWKAGQLDLLDDICLDQFSLSPDFRRQLKARAMEYGFPIQIIRESTLHPSDEFALGKRRLSPMSHRMWNIGATAYYKCGGKPWRLATARDGVCYIGLAFRRAGKESGSETACCAAQMFLNSGDGIVFLGQYGPWYSPKTRQFTLTKLAANHLLKGALDTYRQLHGKELREVFLHSRSNISKDEFDGYREACPSETKLVGVRVQTDRLGLRLFRQEENPVIRGTMWKRSNRQCYLWANGFIPRFGTYTGWEVPAPLKIEIQHGNASIDQVAHDILGLTKLNYNSCTFGDSAPVTVKFSDAVGEILVSNPTVTNIRPNFKFYI